MASRTTRAKKTTETSWFPIAAIALLAIGCAADARRRHPPPVKRLSLSFQVDADSELYRLAQAAADRWSKALGITITATPDGIIPILLVEKLSDACQADPESRGCSSVDLQGNDNWIEILSSVDEEQRFGVLMHEMGHHLRGERGHLEGPPDALMIANRGVNVTRVTPADVAWVCSGPRIACQLTSS